MAATKVYAPNRQFRGLIAGVRFADGVADVDADNGAALAYFRRRGFGIGERPATPAAPDHVDARDVAGPEPVGTRLRDAAVKPEPDDFLPPVNAGEADPHGPEVVAPGIHGTPPTPIVPGDAHVDAVEQQEAEQSAAAESVLVEGAPATSVGETGEPVTRPAKSATKGAWVDYAVAQGAERSDVDGMTKAELVARYGGE